MSHEYLKFVSLHRDGEPVVCAESDGQQSHGRQAEDGGEGQGDGAAEAHGGWWVGRLVAPSLLLTNLTPPQSEGTATLRQVGLRARRGRAGAHTHRCHRSMASSHQGLEIWTPAEVAIVFCSISRKKHSISVVFFLPAGSLCSSGGKVCPAVTTCPPTIGRISHITPLGQYKWRRPNSPSCHLEVSTKLLTPDSCTHLTPDS